MTLKERYLAVIESIAFRGLRSRNFVALMGVADARGLSALLQQVDEQQPYADIYGLHNLRWTLFYPNRCNDGTVASIDEPQALVLSLIFDGRLDDTLRGLIARPEGRLSEILSYCCGFEPASDVLAFLKERETKPGYFFRDLGPLILPPKGQGAFSVAREPDPTRSQIEDAEAVRRRFEEFYAEHSHLPVGQLREAFVAAFSSDAFPFPLTRVERRRSDEDSWVRHMIDTARKRQVSAALRSSDHVVRRDVHAKGHGLLEATFEVVLPEAPDLRVGLFAAPGSYRAVLRPSNGDSQVHPDAKPDARGLALRVLLPDRLAGKRPKYLLSGSGDGWQDFVLMNSPVFFAPDIKSLALLSATERLEGTLPRIFGMLALAARPGGLRQAKILLSATRTRLRHPLAAEFHSTTPYLLGEGHVAKYSVEPAPQHSLESSASLADPDFLGRSLEASLERGSIHLQFYVHVLRAHATPAGYESLVDIVEDATIDWSALGAKKVLVANIRIARQERPASSRLREAEATEFNPWNALVEHRPLGSLNRARLSAYRASQSHRAAPPVLAFAADAAE